jgi:hypothetical protein
VILKNMVGICKANGALGVREDPEGSGRYVSYKSNDRVRMQDEAKRKTSIVYAKESTINKVQRDKDGEEKEKATLAGPTNSIAAGTVSAAAVASIYTADVHADEEAKAKMLALEKRNMATVAMRRVKDAGAVNMGGRGVGRRPSATAADGDDIPSANDRDYDKHHESAIQALEGTKLEDDPSHHGHHVQIQMQKPNIMSGRGRGGRGLGGRGGPPASASAPASNPPQPPEFS